MSEQSTTHKEKSPVNVYTVNTCFQYAVEEEEKCIQLTKRKSLVINYTKHIKIFL